MIRHPEVNVALTFVNDIPRSEWYKKILQDSVKDRTVFEIGTGIGLLGAYCLEFGAKHFYGIDIRSSRTQVTNNVLDSLGYQGRHTVFTADFMSLRPEDFPTDIDLLLCEPVGHQFSTSTTVKKIWQHANHIIKKPYISIPDTWAVDVEIYEGQLNNVLPDCQPKIMLNYEALPTGFYQAVADTNLINPTETINSIIEITPSCAEQELSFILDLSDYKSATVVVKDHTSFQGSICQGISYTTDWPPPHKIVIPHAGKKFLFRWDPNARRLPDFKNGFWTWHQCE
jgi:hypothetical protein